MEALKAGQYPFICDSVLMRPLPTQDVHNFTIANRSQCMERESSNLFYEK
jgi:hypothetical protein